MPETTTAQWTHEDQCAADEEGWNLFNTYPGTGEPRLERDDEAAVFDDDADVWALVGKGTTPLHQRAMQFLLEHSRDEYDRVIAHLNTIDPATTWV